MTARIDANTDRAALDAAIARMRGATESVTLTAREARLLVGAVDHYREGMTWETTCSNCAQLLTQLYAMDHERDRTREVEP